MTNDKQQTNADKIKEKTKLSLYFTSTVIKLTRQETRAEAVESGASAVLSKVCLSADAFDVDFVRTVRQPTPRVSLFCRGQPPFFVSYLEPRFRKPKRKTAA